MLEDVVGTFWLWHLSWHFYRVVIFVHDIFVGGTFVVTNGREVYAVLFAFGGFCRDISEMFMGTLVVTFFLTRCFCYLRALPDVGTIVSTFCRVKWRGGHIFVGTVAE